jgi:[ribosomal protein S5]-alanine N-acetyltransferase
MEIHCRFGRIRPWREGDETALVRHADDTAIWSQVRDLFPTPYTREDAEQWIELAGEDAEITDFAIEVDGEAVGGIGYAQQADVNRCSAEIGYWVGKAWWGRGIATEALTALSDAVFALHPEIVRIYAVPFADNIGSRRVLEKCGYALEGIMCDAAIKNGRLRDQAMYALLRRERT